MERYRIRESVADRTQPVHSYEDLEIHHPTANRRGLLTGRVQDFENPAKRSYARVDGHFEEIRREPDGRTLVKKDFILSREGGGAVHVPAPVSGYVHYLKDRTAAVRIYDRPHDEPGAKLLAQSLHMDRRSFHIPEGGHVAYGQPLGRMSDTGTPGAVHAHIEAEPDQFRRYIRDIDSGAIAPGRWPGKGRAEAIAPDMPRRAVDAPRGADAPSPDRGRSDGVLEHGDRGGDVRALQATLNRLGIRDAQGLPLQEDGDFGRRTRDAVVAFQRVHGLEVDGRVGQDTRDALAAPHGHRITDVRHPDYPLFERVLGHVQAAEGERGVVSGPHSLNVAAALLVQMKRDGIERADRVELNDSGRLIRVIQSGRTGMHEHELSTTPLDTGEASTRSLHASSDQLATLSRHPAQAVAAPAQAEALVPAMAR